MKPKRIKINVGGRGSAKFESISDAILAGKVTHKQAITKLEQNAMLNQQQNQANKMWVDVMKGQPVTFTSDEEVRIISKHSATMSVLEVQQEELAGLIFSGKDIDMFVTMETMKLVMSQLIEAIEDYEE